MLDNTLMLRVIKDYKMIVMLQEKQKYITIHEIQDFLK